MSRRMRSLCVRSLSRLALTLCAGCADFAHTNPFDPETKVDIAIAGPQSTSSLQERLDFTFSSSPAWSGSVSWTSSDPTVLHSVGGGTFSVVGVRPPPDDTASVLVHLGTHVAAYRVQVRQALATFEFTCMAALPGCVFPIGDLDQHIAVLQRDANDFPMMVPLAAQYRSRDTAVLQIQRVAAGSGSGELVFVTPISRGASYVVATAGGVSDSVRVVVP